MTVNCYGVVPWLVLATLLRPCAGQGISLAGGRFQTKTNVTSWLNLALDAADMRETENATEKQGIYTSGRHTNFSFASLSLDSYPLMEQDPMFNIYRHAFLELGKYVEGQQLGYFDQKPVSEYADTLVVDLFKLNLSSLVADAALALNVWMAVLHQLYDVLRACRQSNQTNSQGSMDAALDRAAALWIGADQPAGTSEEGNLLYNLAQATGRMFGEPSGEVLVNKNVLDNMNYLQAGISNATCTQTGGYATMRNYVNTIIRYMSIPLLQKLIHHISEFPSEGGADIVELYSLSLAPQVATCDPANYDKILTLMVLDSLTEANKDEAITTLQSVYSCFQVTCADIGSYESGAVAQCSDTKPDPPPFLAGYVTTFNVDQFAYIDRDILAIKALTRTRAYDAALDYYEYGFSSRTNTNQYLTLYELATTEERTTAGRQFSLFTQYYDSNNYADSMIRNALTPVIPFTDASDGQLAEIVGGVLSYMIMFMAVVQQFFTAIEACQTGGTDATDASTHLWDQGVAYFVGSIEGTKAGGREGGQLLYGIGKSLCKTFDTCGSSQDVVNYFTNVSDFLSLGLCTDASTTLKDQIIGMIAAPLIQGVLDSAVTNAKLPTGSNATSLGTGYAFSNSILPLVNAANFNSSVTLLRNMQFTLTSKPVPGGPEDVFEAIRIALPYMDTKCKSVGEYQNVTYGNLCDVGTQVPSTPLGFGRYTFTFDVEALAAIALDVRDMKAASSIEEANVTYTKGGNAQIQENGKLVNLTLASFSTEAADYMAQDPMFNIFRFALLEESVFGDGSVTSDSAYGDTVVQKAFIVAEDVMLAADATVVMQIWMQITHRLYEATRSCKAGQGNATRSIDEAVALWIGSGQPEGSYGTGYLMYSIAQAAAMNFGLPESESSVNEKVIALFNEAKTLTDNCDQTPSNFIQLRDVTSKILTVMSIPLLQNLMYYIHVLTLNETDVVNEVELYALSIVPQAIGCKPSTYYFLEDVLLDEYISLTNITDDFFMSMMELQKCLRINCVDIMAASIPDEELMTTVNSMCYEGDANKPVSIVGYVPSTDVDEYLRIDIDILQIGIFMETGAKDAAIDFYTNGYNSRSASRFFSLHELATMQSRKNVSEQFKMFSDFYKSENYADDIIMDALDGRGQFGQATNYQLAEIAVATLQCMVSYMALLGDAYSAVKECQAKRQGSQLWDKAVALFVGSIEGEERGGDLGGYGQLLYGLSNDMCIKFGTCEGSGDSMSNEFLIEVFTEGQGLIQKGDCDGATSLIEDQLLPTLPVSMIQGTLFFATLAEDAGSTNETLADVYALSRSILPLVNGANATSGATINITLDFRPSENPVQDVSQAIFSAIEDALPGMRTDCHDIGIWNNRSVCSANLEPDPDTPTNLGDGLYTTTTYVQDRANIALDVAKIKDELTGDGIKVAKDVYEVGENSYIFNNNGIKIGQRTLQGFSTKETLEMKEEPVFNIYKYAFGDEQGQYLGSDVRLYADTIVQAAFSNTNPSSKTIAAEAMVALNVWMMLVHELFEMLHDCKNKQIADADGIHSIDEAVAYWIGDGQVSGDPKKGNLLYALAELMGERFGLDQTGQTRTNTNILRLFNQAKLELSFPNACSENPKTLPRLRQIVNNIVSLMVVPLVQGVIYYLNVNDRDRVKLYAQAFVPLVAGCNPTTFNFLRDKLISLTYNVVEVDDIVARIITTYDCLGITCDDVGLLQNMGDEICLDTPVLNPIAGYRPQIDVRPYAMLDLDILHVSILMEMNATSAAEDLYVYGKHAVTDGIDGSEILSLYQLATTSQRSLVPQYDSFVRYYQNNKYADGIVRQGFDPNQLSAASAQQRKEYVVKSLQYLVVYMAVLQAMYETIADCESSSPRLLDGEEAWDRAAALLIGSLEGTKLGGDDDGLMLYSLAKKRCVQFGTCTETGDATVNEKLVSLLYTGRGAVSSRSCGAVRKAVTQVEPVLLVPLIQSTLRFAIVNEKLPQITADDALAEGFIFSRSVLPLIEDADRDSAATINKNMDFQFVTKHVPDGAASVFNAFAKTYAKMGVACEQVGTVDGIDACNGATQSSSDGNDTKVGLIVGIVVGVLAVMALVALYFAKTRKREDEKVEFLAPRGEMNHESDLLNGMKGGEKDGLVMDTTEDLEAAPETSPMAQSDDSSFT